MYLALSPTVHEYFSTCSICMWKRFFFK